MALYAIDIQQLRHEKKELSDKVDETKSQTNLLTEQSTKLANQIDNIEGLKKHNVYVNDNLQQERE